MTNYILEILLKNNFTRTDCLIAIGGGITGDIVGFAASFYKRGMTIHQHTYHTIITSRLFNWW